MRNDDDGLFGSVWGKTPCATLWLPDLTRNPRFCRSDSRDRIALPVANHGCFGEEYGWNYGLRCRLGKGGGQLLDRLGDHLSGLRFGYNVGLRQQCWPVLLIDPDAHTREGRKGGGREREKKGD